MSTATKRKAFHRDPNTLHCYVCVREGRPGTSLRVSNDVVKRKRTRRGDGGSRVYDQVAIDCLTCGHQWYSMHPDALKRSRQQDKNLARRHGGQT